MSETRFIFATGIECSYPIVQAPDGRRTRIDELEKTFHYARWREDLALVHDLGLHYLRYGLPYHRVHVAPDTYDWEFTDQVFAEMRRLGITPIVDLCHFGVPDWIENFQNPKFPEHFARYARAFAVRFPWMQLYTPVNEAYVCAKFSALHGLWNECRRDERSFVTALKNLCRANLLAIREILAARQDAVFIQSESAEQFHAGARNSACVALTRFENERRFLSFDLLLSKPPSSTMTLYLMDNGMTRDELEWFMGHGLDERIVMGNDFYERNEQLVLPNGEMRPCGEVFGWAAITQHYHSRYRRAVMHTETNRISGSLRNVDDGPRWLWKQFLNVRLLRDQEIPVIGFTWYSLVDQVDWDTALVQDRGVVNPVGLFDLQRRPNAVAGAYKEMMGEFAQEPLVPGGAVLGLVSTLHCPSHNTAG